MSGSFWCIDRATHIKIVAVSLTAASVVVAVAMNARTPDSGQPRSEVVRTGSPASFSANDTSIIR
jgi:hypothetical protein